MVLALLFWYYLIYGTVSSFYLHFIETCRMKTEEVEKKMKFQIALFLTGLL